ncbi:hypothetical protein BYT27DRAFT_7210594 [Phlegmacium glaucopus]|nr:hypothetical protein BYT27DRAFT_7210594 [Phlegmacium glaucopus]
MTCTTYDDDICPVLFYRCYKETTVDYKETTCRLQGGYKETTRRLQGDYKEATRRLQGGYKETTRRLHSTVQKIYLLYSYYSYYSQLQALHSTAVDCTRMSAVNNAGAGEARRLPSRNPSMVDCNPTIQQRRRKPYDRVDLPASHNQDCSTPTKVKECYKCGQEGHISRDCTENSSNRGGAWGNSGGGRSGGVVENVTNVVKSGGPHRGLENLKLFIAGSTSGSKIPTVIPSPTRRHGHHLHLHRCADVNACTGYVGFDSFF